MGKTDYSQNWKIGQVLSPALSGNKRGAVGDVFNTLPVLLIVLVLSVVLIIITSSMGSFRERGILVYEEAQDFGLMFEKVNVEIINGKIVKEMFVYEALVLFDRGEVEKEGLIEALKKEMSLDNNCLIVSFNDVSGGVGVPFAYKLSGEGHENLGAGVLGFYEKNDNFILIPAKSGEESVLIGYYYGGCLE